MAHIEFTREDLEAEAAMLAYSLRRAEVTDRDSRGEWEIRGALSHCLSCLGLWDDSLSPDRDHEIEREVEFQTIVDEFAARHA